MSEYEQARYKSERFRLHIYSASYMGIHDIKNLEIVMLPLALLFCVINASIRQHPRAIAARSIVLIN